MCNGSGYEEEPRSRRTGNKVPDYSAIVKLADKLFVADNLKKLYDAMKLLDVETAIMKYTVGATNRQAQFKVSEHIDILIMPILKNEFEDV